MTTGIHVSTANSAASASVDTSGSTRTTTAGSTLVALMTSISDDFAASNPFTDSKSNSWTQIQTPQDAGGRHSRAYYSKIASAGAGHYFTVNLNSAAYCFFGVIEILDGASTPNILGARQNDTASPYDSPTVSPSTSCQIIGFASLDVVTGADTHTWGGSFASGDKIESQTDGDNFTTGSIATTTKAAGTYNSSVTSTQSPGAAAMWIVSVDLAAVGGVVLEHPFARGNMNPVAARAPVGHEQGPFAYDRRRKIFIPKRLAA